MNYCTHCGNALTFGQIGSDPIKRYYCPSCGMIHYANPKMIVGCVPYSGSKVLLCKRAIEPFVGFWNVPAGFLENGETVEEGAQRETWEEANGKVAIETLHTVFSITHINQIYLHFRAQLLNPEAIFPGEESLEAEFFDQESIPWQDLAFSSTQFALEKYFDYVNEGTQAPHVGSYIKYRRV